jgi:sec-independent protein translocase protein TatC
VSLFRKGDENLKEKEMGFLDHLEELRWHILRSALAILVCAVGVFLAKDFVFNTVIYGPLKADFPTYRFLCSLGEAACIKPAENFKLSTREFGEQFFVHLTVSIWLGLIMSFPIIVNEIWRFVKPGLYEKEKNATRNIVFVCSVLFISGVLFGYYLVSPFAISFLSNYSVGTETINAPTLSSYVNYITMFTIPTGLIFELPIGAYFLGKIGILSSDFLRSYRKHAAVVIVIIAAVVTPPDVISQILISLPMLFLYEVSIIVVKNIEKKNLLLEPEKESKEITNV